jgi:1-acyl-sn-glycerol-3-phosphate acyltransferase
MVQRPMHLPVAPGGVRGLLLGLYQVPMFYLALLMMGVVQLCWSLIAFLIRHSVSEETGRRIGRRFVSRLYRYCFRVTGLLGLLRVDASALDAIDPDEPLIIAPNHPSVVDALILISRLEKLNCIMKASVLDNILLGSGARLAGYIRNDGVKRMLRLSAMDLKQGGQLIIFPEGTRTIAAPVNPFKCGFAAMAKTARVPIQTVFIETDTPYLSKGWPILKKPKHLPMTFRVRLGERFEVDQDVNAFVDRLHGYFARELAHAQLGELWDAKSPEAAHDTADAHGEALHPAFRPHDGSLQR